jgi:hypothetical protein
MLHPCAVKFNVTENLVFFLVFGWTKQGLSHHMCEIPALHYIAEFLQIGLAWPPHLMIRSAVGNLRWSKSQMKNRHLGSALIFQMLFQSISENAPVNRMLYADFAEYWPDVCFQATSSSYFCSSIHCSWLLKSTNWCNSWSVVIHCKPRIHRFHCSTFWFFRQASL